jgi:subtilisin family serine protease
MATVSIAGAALFVPGGPLPPATAVAARCQRLEPGGGLVREIPWAQLMLAPERAWPFSTGAGVTVAVVDSGTDAEHPQPSGRSGPVSTW